MMTLLTIVTEMAIMAQAESANRWESFSEAFGNRRRPETDAGTDAVIIYAAVAAALAILLLLIKYHRESGAGASAGRPVQFFIQALTRLGVDRRDRRLMRRVARRSGLANPAVMLFSDALFTQHTSNWLERIRFSGLRATYQRRVNRIQQRLFE